MTQMQALGHPRNGWLALAAVLMCSSPSIALATACPVRGDAKQALAKNLNVYKNRIAAPAAHQIDASVTLAALLAPGPDLNRWDRRRAAIVEGVIVKVKTAGVESANCHAKDAAHRDTHIEIALSRSAPSREHVIVEITPRWRTKMRALDWSPARLRTLMVPGKTLRVTGWLFDDLEHLNAAENTHPGGVHNWRATVWEIHPVTGFSVLP
jgi:cellulase/cellobiase CelA1